METTDNVEREKLLSEDSNKDVINKWLLFDIIAIIFFGTLCSSLPVSFYAWEYSKRGGGYVEAGVILQIHPVMLGLTAWLFGKLIPQFGYKSIAVFGILLEGTAQIGFALTSYIENITLYTVLSVFMRVLTGIGNGAAKTTVYAIAATEFGKNSTWMLGIIQSFSSFSYLVGSSIGAGLYKVTGTMPFPLLVPGVLYLVSVLRFFIFYKQSMEKESSKKVKVSSALTLMSSPPLIGATLIQMYLRGTNGYRSAYLTIYMEEIGLSVVDSGVLLSVSAFLFMIGSATCGKFITEHRKIVPLAMVICCTLWATTWLSITITNNKWNWLVFIGFSLNGLLRSVVVLCVYDFALEHVRTMDIDMTLNERNSCLVGVWTSAINLGRFLFTVVGGAMIEITGSAAKTNIGFAAIGYVTAIGTIVLNFWHYISTRK